MNNASLVEIAELLKTINSEKRSPGVAIPNYLPQENSTAILIKDKKYVVVDTNLNTNNSIDKPVEGEAQKYNYFFYNSINSAKDSDGWDIIDNERNKKVLLEEAYSEVAFFKQEVNLQLDNIADDTRDSIESAISDSIIDKNDPEIGSIKVSIISGESAAADYVYRCSCIFRSINENDEPKNILVYATYIGENEYKYNVVDSVDEKKFQEKLKNADNRKVPLEEETEEYDPNFKKNLEDALEAYYLKDSNIERITVQAVYCIKYLKTPIKVEFKKKNPRADESEFLDAEYITYYSPFFAKEEESIQNSFTCPICKNDSKANAQNNKEPMKLHIDKELKINIGKDKFLYPIGCNECMKQCKRCGKWHLKSIYIKGDGKQQKGLLDKGYEINRDTQSKKDFLRNITTVEDTVNYCDCKEYLSWIHDEMYPDGQDRVISHFLTGAQSKGDTKRYSFINCLTGEEIATDADFAKYSYKYLVNNLDRKNRDKLINGKGDRDENKLFNFIFGVLEDASGKYDDFKEDYVEYGCLESFKEELGAIVNVPADYIKITLASNIKTCKSCGGDYFFDSDKSYAIKVPGSEDEYICNCCNVATTNNKVLKIWRRAEDNVIYYRSKENIEEGKVVRVLEHASELSKIDYKSYIRQAVEKLIK